LEKVIEQNLQNIALSNSINLDKGQLIVASYFDKLNEKLVKSNTKKNFINKIFSKKNYKYIKWI
jgi:hypothetical protein